VSLPFSDDNVYILSQPARRLVRNRQSAHQHREKQRLYKLDLEEYNKGILREYQHVMCVSQDVCVLLFPCYIRSACVSGVQHASQPSQAELHVPVRVLANL
jgi:hypothetical protein